MKGFRSPLVPKRVPSDELLDAHDAPLEDVERSLIDLRRINAWLGGRSAWNRLMKRAGWLASHGTVLEIGTGTSDLLENSPAARRIGLDLKIEHLVFGRRIGDRSILRVVGDAGSLPFRDGAVDLVGSSHFFHHFSLDHNQQITEECLRVAHASVCITDTRRNWIPLLFVELLGFLGVVGTITRHDAPASVRQGYTLGEIRSFVNRFRDVDAHVFRLLPFRFGVVLFKRHPAPTAHPGVR